MKHQNVHPIFAGTLDAMTRYLPTVEVEPDSAFDICPHCEKVYDDDGRPACKCAAHREPGVT